MGNTNVSLVDCYGNNNNNKYSQFLIYTGPKEND